ncbi:putative TIMELESS/TIM-1 protein [Daphnia pulex]|uniref:Putative TIMELESS/TIM-1 protein n=1 Tax=Daphnia pulex TaxID=6669 RepID=E9FZU1_DAPPU|nr:putative TIMELESS/TIM-1 protein [Daphnia pulex]|eukprot:EFX87203.1 putative TIMELESS/TIM-1 protein [Daphnia pulex]
METKHDLGLEWHKMTDMRSTAGVDFPDIQKSPQFRFSYSHDRRNPHGRWHPDYCCGSKMERRMTLSGHVPSLSLIPLGTCHNGKYYIDGECLVHLEEINIKLINEDPITRPLRCALAFLDILNKDLIPILINSQDQSSILNSTIKLLAELTTPLECLGMVDLASQSNQSITATQQVVIYKLTQLLCNAKESFLDGGAMPAVFRHVRHTLEKEPLSSDDNLSVNHSLLLIRNILHAPERSTQMADKGQDQQDQLVRIVLAQGLDRLLISLLACAQKEQWLVAVVQLISLLYKDRPVEMILQILDEKCTHLDGDQQNQLGSKKSEKSLKKLSMKCKLGRPVEMKGNVVEYKPTDESTLILLKGFTINFIRQGYNTLVGQLHQQMLKQHGDAHFQLLDKSHFLWLISYFLPIASRLELSVEHLKDVLTIDLLCYLTWETVQQTEELEINAFQHSVDLKPCVRRLHLCVKAIREYLKTLERFSRPLTSRNANAPDNLITRLGGYVPAIRDLRQLFLLQLRQFDPVVQSRRYLLDVIATNHILLLALERSTAGQSSRGSFDISQHLTQFCSEMIVDRYGTALEDFQTNGPFVNDCILTILHHVAGDLGRADLLCRPVILRPFSKIWAAEFNMCDDWNDLIELIIKKSMRSFQKSSIKETLRSNPNEPQEIKVSASHLTETLPLKYSNEIPESADKNHLSCQVPDTNNQSLLIQLKDSGFQKQLEWIQSSLLSACAVRLGTYSGQEFRHPITCLSFQMNLSCPLVPWTEVEASALRSELFLNLLFRIGLIPPSPQPVLYPRIPREWSPDTLYSVALLFGPVDQKRIDFDLTRVKKIELDLPNLPINVQNVQRPSLHSYIIHEGVSYREDSFLESKFPSAEINIPGQNSIDGDFDQQHSLRPLDSISTTSSLEVHKMDSSDDEEMEDLLFVTDEADYGCDVTR